jgi:(2Fe-2S) ferredoxin
VRQPQSRFRCADAARERGDPLAGSAPQTRRWLLLEHPGPWAIDAVAGSGIEPTILEGLTVAAQQTMSRILLVRRPGRRNLRAERRWTVAGIDAGTVQGPWQTDTDLLVAIDVLLSDAPQRTGLEEPLVLVCTHGVHDTCCALRGRPVAAFLAKRWPELVWECSHVGGDRFAPNVVMLPEGFYYGNLDADQAVGAIERHLAGAVPSKYLRGMTRYPPPVQAAVAVAYERCPPLGPSDITVRSVKQIGPHEGHGSETFVDLEVPALGAAFRVEILSLRRREAQLTCRAGRETPATEYRLQHFERTAGG